MDWRQKIGFFIGSLNRISPTLLKSFVRGKKRRKTFPALGKKISQDRPGENKEEGMAAVSVAPMNLRLNFLGGRVGVELCPL